MKKYDVVCIGMAILDSIIRGFDPEPVSAAGFRAASGSINVGGDAVNEAMASSKLGLRTAIMCSLGRDPAGDMIINELTKSGVDTYPVIRSEDHPTPVTTIFVRDDGNRRSITNEAHRYNFHPERYGELFTDTGAIIMGSLFRAPFNDPDVVRSVLARVKSGTREGEPETIVFADTKLPNFRKLSLEDLRDCLPMIDYLTPNYDEAAYYTGKTDPEDMAETFLKYGVRNVIIKMGPDGCYFANSEGGLYMPAYKVAVVDATGAGDNFIAGFVSEILKGRSQQEALRFAAACGAICTTKVGAGSALKSREQVLGFISAGKEKQ